MKLHHHPLSTYSQKALIALYEKNVDFASEIIDLFDPEKRAAYKRFYPLGKIPVLVDGDRFIPESSIIIEYVEGKSETGTRLIPRDPEQARRTRFHDRLADLYVNDPTAFLFLDSQKPEAQRESARVTQAKERLDASFQYLDGHLGKRSWLVAEAFTMADCALAPPLAYLRNMYPFAAYPSLTAYWNRLAERPSVRRVLDEAAPYLARFAAGR
jgi:glutathione S-transferase